MVKLIIHIQGAPDRIVEIRSGPHQIGRDHGSDIVILHPSVSSRHCMVELCEEGLLIRDLGSTNGTELDGQPVLEATAQTGQVIRIGSVACTVEGVVPKVVIPKWEQPPPPELPPGVKPCCNHPEFGASMKCSHCQALFCGACVHLMRRQGGTLHKLCPICSHHCVPLEGMNVPNSQSTLLGLLKRMIPRSGTRRLRRGGRRFK